MTDRSKFEQMLEYLINEDQEKAKELFHDIVVEKSREIYENLLQDDFEEEEALKVLKILQENAAESYILKEKLFRSELPFTGRQNLTLEESKKLKSSLSAIDGTQVTIKRSDQLEGG
jgi:hypothetical protein